MPSKAAIEPSEATWMRDYRALGRMVPSLLPATSGAGREGRDGNTQGA
jgi:hypothetical protein